MFVLLIAALLAIPEAPAFAPAEVQAYLSALEAVESRSRVGSVEDTFSKSLALRTALLRSTDDGTYLESVGQDQFDALSGLLRGMILNREELVVAQPDPAFYLDLALRFGGNADVEFFRNYSATFPDGVWRSYLEQQTDATACTDFASGQLVERYAGWLSFRSSYPGRYSETVGSKIEASEQELTEGSCACGTQEEFVRELATFAERFPRSPATPGILERIQEIRRGRATVRFHCESG